MRAIAIRTNASRVSLSFIFKRLCLLVIGHSAPLLRLYTNLRIRLRGLVEGVGALESPPPRTRRLVIGFSDRAKLALTDDIVNGFYNLVGNSLSSRVYGLSSSWLSRCSRSDSR